MEIQAGKVSEVHAMYTNSMAKFVLADSTSRSSVIFRHSHLDLRCVLAKQATSLPVLVKSLQTVYIEIEM